MRLSKKYGLNPSIMCCPIYGKEIGVALLGANGGKEAPKKSIGLELCDDCEAEVKNGYVFILAVNETEKGIQLTGHYAKVNNKDLTIDPPSNGIMLMDVSSFHKTFNNDA